MLRILVADDHEIVRHGVRGVLSEHNGWEVCGEAKDGREAVRLACELEPDVVVMDLSLPELDGLEATRRIRLALPGSEVLMLSNCGELVSEALLAGARGYVLKSDSEHQLKAAVEALAHHQPYFNSVVSDAILHSFLKSTRAEHPAAKILTGREREVVQMLPEGQNNRDIAAKLSISTKTVETHRASAMRKLDVNSIVQLVRYAIRNSLVEA